MSIAAAAPATAAPADAVTTTAATTPARPFSMETSAFPAHPAPPPELCNARPDPEPVTVVDTEAALRRAARDETEQIGDRIAELAAHLKRPPTAC